ncbi:hypothetical protein [Rufibacter ruber]|uniref:hypothetical protein n=1 Tax=Rufibacter ruber TaxID=1783499 RepID=UPI0008301436|nr:hypothetical protein [Rufibacter ruber]
MSLPLRLLFLKVLLMGFLFLPKPSVLAQPMKLGVRTEMESSPFSDRHWLQPLPDSSLLLVTTRSGSVTKKDHFLVSKLNHQLQPVWQQRFEQQPLTKLVGVSSDSQLFYLLFSISGTPSLLLYQISSSTGQAWLTRHEQTAGNVTITGMSVAAGQLLICAQQQRTGTTLLLALDPAQQQLSLLPAMYHSKEQLTDVRTDHALRLTDLVATETNSLQSRFKINQISPRGDLKESLVVPAQLNSVFQQARITTGITPSKQIIGTYGDRGSSFTKGIFSSGLAGNATFYELGQLQHIFEYEHTPKLQRLKRRYNRQKAKGKDFSLRQQVYLHQATAHPAGFSVVAEVYKTIYSKVPFEPGPAYTQVANSSVTVGSKQQGFFQFRSEHAPTTTMLQGKRIYVSYRFQAALILVFDQGGNLIEEGSIALQHHKTTVSPTVTSAVNPQGELALAYVKDGSLHYSLFRNSSWRLQPPVALQQDGYEGKPILKEPDGVLPWYNQNLLAYGYRRLPTKEGKSKSVLFLQRILFQ